MATNPTGKGTKTVGVNMPIEEAAEFERRARSMGISTGKYIKTILRRWIESGAKLELKED